MAFCGLQARDADAYYNCPQTREEDHLRWSRGGSRRSDRVESAQMSEELPEDVRLFIAKNVWTLEQLEILLLLANAPEKKWTVETTYSSILSSRISIEHWLEQFARMGFLDRIEGDPKTFQYKPGHPVAGVVA